MNSSTARISVSANEPVEIVSQNDFDSLTNAYIACSDDLPSIVKIGISQALRHVHGCEECLDFLARQEMLKRVRLN